MLWRNEDYVNPPMIEVERVEAKDEKPQRKQKQANKTA